MSRSSIVAFVGPHNSGKTGLVERIGRLATGAGWEVGIIKRAARPLAFDRHGRDSARFLESGVSRVVTAAPEMLFVQEARQKPETLMSLARRFGTGIQVWLVESYSPETVPWIRVGRLGQRVPEVDRYCIATVGQRAAGRALPHFRLDRPKVLFGFLNVTWQGRSQHRG
jgi:molybdopterin-guanine dinucleotide biosynthesis protein B